MEIKVKTPKKEKAVKQLTDVKKLRNLLKELSPIDAMLVVERIQAGSDSMKEAMKTEKSAVLLTMYESLITKVETHLPKKK